MHATVRCWPCFGFNGHFLHNWSCPNIWLVIFITAPAHPHATVVAVYPALFISRSIFHVVFNVVNKRANLPLFLIVTTTLPIYTQLSCLNHCPWPITRDYPKFEPLPLPNYTRFILLWIHLCCSFSFLFFWSFVSLGFSYTLAYIGLPVQKNVAAIHIFYLVSFFAGS